MKLSKKLSSIKEFITNWVNPNWNKLTRLEREYSQILFANSGVLAIHGKPGTAKTAVLASIANKCGLNYMDIRLSQYDETDVGGVPSKIQYKMDMSKEYLTYLYKESDSKEESFEDFSKRLNQERGAENVFTYSVPQWVVDANKHPTLVVFEELNRARLEVRNAALRILLEKAVHDFQLSNQVFMAITGNLGDEDGTQVESLYDDSAIIDRIIPVKHNLSYQDWYDGYAKDRVLPIICDYLGSNQDKLHNLQLVMQSDLTGSYASPRSWSFLSDQLAVWLDDPENPKIEDVIHQCKSNGKAIRFVGAAAATHFINWMQDQLKFSLKDILDNYHRKDVRDKVKNHYGRDKYSEWVQILCSDYPNILSLFTEDEKFSEKTQKTRFENAMRFLSDVSADESFDYIRKATATIAETLTKMKADGFQREDFPKHLVKFMITFREINLDVMGGNAK